MGTWRTRNTSMWLFVVLLAGCDGGDVGLVVEVRTDLVAGVEFEALTVALSGEDLMDGRTVRSGELGPFRAAEWAALSPNAERRLVVSARDGMGRVVVQRTALVDHRQTTLTSVVLTRSCADVVCPAEQACIGGQCVDERCLNGDEASCVVDLCAECAALSECDDAMCEEAVCLHRAASDRCRDVDVCIPDRGCQPVLAPADAGPMDAGPTDAGRDGGRDAGAPDAADADVVDGGPDAGADAGPPRLCTPPGGECDYALQDCPAGQSCAPRSFGGAPTSRCVPAGTGTDVTCMTSAACAPGWDCIGGLCVEVCCSGDGPATCSVSGAACGFDPTGLGGHCFPDTCSIEMQTGCPDGDACYVVALGSVAACLDEGSASIGEPCVGTNDCQRGSGCSAAGTCAAFCSASLDCTGPSENCIIGSGETIGLCEESCDPVSGTGCVGGLSCYPVAANMASCFPSGLLAEGEPCLLVNDCQDGLVCLTGACARICSATGPSCGSELCTPLSGLPPWSVCL
ncbi:MAG: hypothetical protein AB8I08_11155 [Sandaracinaceae bacterium]